VFVPWLSSTACVSRVCSEGFHQETFKHEKFILRRATLGAKFLVCRSKANAMVTSQNSERYNKYYTHCLVAVLEHNSGQCSLDSRVNKWPHFFAVRDIAISQITFPHGCSEPCCDLCQRCKFLMSTLNFSTRFSSLVSLIL